VAVEGGLLTVVCKDTDQKPLRQISAEIKEMVARARQGKVRPDDIEGSTFSISNLGMFDVENFAAIINPPQAGILAVSAGLHRAVVKDGALAIATMMTVTLSVDHRIVDGALAAEWLQEFKRIVEDPLQMML